MKNALSIKEGKLAVTNSNFNKLLKTKEICEKNITKDDCFNLFMTMIKKEFEKRKIPFSIEGINSLLSFYSIKGTEKINLKNLAIIDQMTLDFYTNNPLVNICYDTTKENINQSHTPSEIMLHKAFENFCKVITDGGRIVPPFVAKIQGHSNYNVISGRHFMFILSLIANYLSDDIMVPVFIYEKVLTEKEAQRMAHEHNATRRASTSERSLSEVISKEHASNGNKFTFLGSLLENSKSWKEGQRAFFFRHEEGNDVEVSGCLIKFAIERSHGNKHASEGYVCTNSMGEFYGNLTYKWLKQEYNAIKKSGLSVSEKLINLEAKNNHCTHLATNIINAFYDGFVEYFESKYDNDEINNKDREEFINLFFKAIMSYQPAGALGRFLKEELGNEMPDVQSAMQVSYVYGMGVADKTMYDRQNNEGTYIIKGSMRPNEMVYILESIKESKFITKNKKCGRNYFKRIEGFNSESNLINGGILAQEMS